MDRDAFVRAALETKSNVESTRWEPRPGDALVGRLERVVSVETEYGPGRFLVVNDPQLGLMSIWVTIAIKSGLEKTGLKEGDGIGIVFRGLKTSKNGNRYRDYVLAPAE